MWERRWSLVDWRGRLNPLGEAPFPRPRKSPTDVLGNLSIAPVCRKSERVALGQEEAVWLRRAPIWGVPFLRVSCIWAGPAWGLGYVPRAEIAEDGMSHLSCRAKRGDSTQKAPSWARGHKDIWEPDGVHASACLVLNRVEGGTRTKLKNSWGLRQGIPGVNL